MKTVTPLLILQILASLSTFGTGLFPGADPLNTNTLPLRLARGEQISVTIDPSAPTRKANTQVGGVAMTSLSRWSTGFGSDGVWSEGLMPFSIETGEYTLPPALENAFIDMELPTTRFYGIIHEEPFDNLPDSLDAIALYMDKIHIPQDRTVIEADPWHANTTFTPQEWADMASYSLEKGYGFRYWEVGNEVYQQIWGEDGQAFPTPTTYINHFIAVSQAIKAVQPDALIGISVQRSGRTWTTNILEDAAGYYDFVCPHFYGGFFNVATAPFEDVVINDNHTQMNRILSVNRLLQQFNPDKETFIYDTEWGLHAQLYNESGQVIDAADFQPKNGNIMGTLYRAVRLVYYARENLVRGATGWKSLTRLANPGFATLYYTEPERRTMLYWLHYYFNRSLHEDVAQLSGQVPYHGSYPMVPVIATANPQKNRMTIMLVNGSWQESFPAEIALQDFTPASCNAVVLSHDDLNAYPHLEEKSDFVNDFPVEVNESTLTFDLPPHSVVFIELADASATWANFSVRENYTVDTALWMGDINVYFEPYIWNHSLQSFIYMKEEDVTESGSWGYIFK